MSKPTTPEHPNTRTPDMVQSIVCASAWRRTARRCVRDDADAVDLGLWFLNAAGSTEIR
jgi:hypothetical protein